MRDCMDQPTTRLENRSMTTAKYDQPSWVLMYVMCSTFVLEPMANKVSPIFKMVRSSVIRAGSRFNILISVA